MMDTIGKLPAVGGAAIVLANYKLALASLATTVSPNTTWREFAKGVAEDVLLDMGERP